MLETRAPAGVGDLEIWLHQEPLRLLNAAAVQEVDESFASLAAEDR